MRKFVSLAAVFGMGLAGFQSAAKAETWYLLLRVSEGGFPGSPVIPIGSQEECETARLKVTTSKEFNNHAVKTVGMCIKGQ